MTFTTILIDDVADKKYVYKSDTIEGAKYIAILLLKSNNAREIDIRYLSENFDGEYIAKAGWGKSVVGVVES
jgi:hypothetical protein